MEADLKEAQQARARLEETLQRTLASKRRAEEALRKARERGDGGACPVTATAAALEPKGACPSPLGMDQQQEKQQQQRQAVLELELRQAATLIADLQKRLRARREVCSRLWGGCF
jgi:hypothetical protein